MNIELRPIADIKPYEVNPRRNAMAVNAVARSIKEFGFRQPIVVDSAGVIIVGHVRWKAAQKLQMETVPVHVAEDMSPEQARAYRIADNKLNQLAAWDADLLAIELSEVRDSGIDLMLLGFSDKELGEYLRQFDTDIADVLAGAEAGVLIRCPKCGHEFSPPEIKA